VVTAIKKELLDVDWRFLAFSLDQAHAEEGETPVWERPPLERGTGVLSLQWGIAIRDHFNDLFFDFHLAMFAARFDDGRKIGKEEVVRDVAASAGLDVDAVAAEVESGRPLATLAAEHTESVDRWAMFGVPTFCEGDEAVFVRFMERDRTDDLERMLELLGWDRLNEFKRTQIAR
jgi:DSBA-like thioredoxin domain